MTSVAQAKKPPQSLRKISWTRLVILIVIAVAVYTVATQVNGFSSAVQALKQAKISWLLLAVISVLVSFKAAALVYVFLAKQRLALWPSTVVQLAGTFANRLLPSGVGAIAVNYHYLRLHKHNEGQASAVVSVNNLLGFVGNMLLLGIFLMMSQGPANLHWPHLKTGLLIGIGLLGVLILVLVFRLFGKKLRRNVRSFRQAIVSYERQPLSVAYALLASMMLTLCYTACLYACAQAVSIHLSFVVIFICMTVGVAGATATPTPGGLGGAEAALVAALLVYDVNRSQALAAVLLYRLCTFWLPIAIGSLAFMYARKRQYI